MIQDEFQPHLASGLTTVCRCWSVKRSDGSTLGFTDHDKDISFDGVVFMADTGMTASAIEREVGLSVDNSEAVGALSAAAIEAEDIKAGRYDRAVVTCWLVNWSDPPQRHVLFAGQLGEISNDGHMFRAELRGLSEPLNQAQGREYRPTCAAFLGDDACGIDISDPVYSADASILVVNPNGRIEVDCPQTYPAGWFAHGRLDVLSGAGIGLSRPIRFDAISGNSRMIDLWAVSGAVLAPGDHVRLVAGCDRRFETCRVKFSNGVNFRGFPHLPGDDWIVAGPKNGGLHNGGSMRG
jgi:uncharacterized phage protein (TIGR02218 family)